MAIETRATHRLEHEPSGIECGAQSGGPVRIVRVELSQPLAALPAVDEGAGRRYPRALAFVRLHTWLLGNVELALGADGLSEAELARAIWRGLGEKINAHLQADGMPPVQELTAAGLPAMGSLACLEERARVLAAAPFASVVVATHDRPESLRRCLDSLLALDYPAYEIIVVDNVPSSDVTASIVRQACGHLTQVRYVREDRRGLAQARNRGLAEAKGAIVVFTDDDVEVDRYWLAEFASGFEAAEHVGCVTGQILPAELETTAQVWSEESRRFGKGYRQRVFDLDKNRQDDPLYPFTAGTFGAGASTAFRTSVLREMGGFDPALGTGSPARGGEELAAFVDVLMRGYRLVYHPAAILYHWHNRSLGSLRDQAYGYGVGLTAYLTSSLVRHPALIPAFALRLPRCVVYALNPRSPMNAGKPAGYPKALDAIERRGMLLGPWAYLRSRWQLHRTHGRRAAGGRAMPIAEAEGQRP